MLLGATEASVARSCGSAGCPSLSAAARREEPTDGYISYVYTEIYLYLYKDIYARLPARAAVYGMVGLAR